MTEAKQNLIDLSRASEDRFVIDWMNGDITLSQKCGALPFCACGSDDLYSAYLRYCRMQGETRPRPQNHFIGSMARRIGWEKGYKDRFNDENSPTGKKRQRMILPSDKDLAAAIIAGLEDFCQKLDESSIKWASRCFFKFRDAIGGDQ